MVRGGVRIAGWTVLSDGGFGGVAMVGGRAIGRLLAGCVVAVGVGAMGGCYFEGGPLWSADQMTLESKPYEPKTISVIDTRTETTIWTLDLPVGQQVVISFAEGRGPNENLPDLMVWGVMEAGRTFGRRENRIAAPAKEARRVEWELRPVPEFADIEIQPAG